MGLFKRKLQPEDALATKKLRRAERETVEIARRVAYMEALVRVFTLQDKRGHNRGV